MSRRSFDRYVMLALKSIRRRRRAEKDAEAKVPYAERRKRTVDRAMELFRSAVATLKFTPRGASYTPPRPKRDPVMWGKPRVLATVAAVQEVRAAFFGRRRAA